MNKEGFSLIELAIVLAIVSILIGGGLVVSQAQIEKSKYDITISRLEAIQEALTLFLSRNGRLPAPAFLSIPRMDPIYGTERITSASAAVNQECTAGYIASEIMFYTYGAGNSMCKGAVPFKSLGLSNDYMFDGWDNKFFYSVQVLFMNNHLTTRTCTTANNSQSSTATQYKCFRAQASGSTGTPLNFVIMNYGNITNSDPVYVLISAGPNGRGAYKSISDGSGGPNTDRNPVASGTAENYNQGMYRFFSETASGGEIAVFDDIIRYKTRNQMVYDCNKKYGLACTLNWGIDFR